MYMSVFTITIGFEKTGYIASLLLPNIKTTETTESVQYLILI